MSFSPAKIKELLKSIAPKTKKKLILGIIVICFIIMISIGYANRTKDREIREEAQKKTTQEFRAFEGNGGALEDTFLNQVQLENEKKDLLIDQLSVQMEELKKKMEEFVVQETEKLNREEEVLPLPLPSNIVDETPHDEDEIEMGKERSFSENLKEKISFVNPNDAGIITDKPLQTPWGQDSFDSKSNLSLPDIPPTIIGGIDKSNFIVEEEITSEAVIQKKNQIYLPPSFMKATTLSGLRAPTLEDGAGNPNPVFIRINDLAVLPNRVKANLKGCFAIAEGYGNLATERYDARLVSISCIDLKGKAVIDQKVQGWLVDADGINGLKGTPVAKFGAHIFRTFLAGFAGGMGEGLSNSQTTSTVSAAGIVTTTEDSMESIFKSGLGRGFSNSSEAVQDFYLKLAAQTLPVIEVGVAKKITIVVSKGVYLELKLFSAEEDDDGIYSN